MFKAGFLGILILFVVDMAWLIAFKIEVMPNILLLLVQGSPLVAGFASSFFAPRNKIVLGISMAIPAAVFAVAITLLFQAFGKAVDFSGVKGSVTLFSITLVYAGVMGAIGGAAGSFLSKLRSQKKDREKQ